MKTVKMFLWLLLAISIVAVGMSGCSEQKAATEQAAAGNTGLNGSEQDAGSRDDSRGSEDNAGAVTGEDPDNPVSSGDISQKESGLPQEVIEVVESSRESAGIKSIEAEGRTYIAVFMGMQPTAGYSLELKETRESGDLWICDLVFRKPAQGMIVAEVITYPYKVIAKNSDKKARVRVFEGDTNKVLMEETLP